MGVRRRSGSTRSHGFRRIFQEVHTWGNKAPRPRAGYGVCNSCIPGHSQCGDRKTKKEVFLSRWTFFTCVWTAAALDSSGHAPLEIHQSDRESLVLVSYQQMSAWGAFRLKWTKGSLQGMQYSQCRGVKLVSRLVFHVFQVKPTLTCSI